MTITDRPGIFLPICLDALDAKAESYIVLAERVSEQIDRLRPTTIAGVLALLECGADGRDELAIAGLRAIVAN